MGLAATDKDIVCDMFPVSVETPGKMANAEGVVGLGRDR